MRHPTRPVPGRSCGECTICCTLFGVDEREKQPLDPCPDCRPGGGCMVYDTRPLQCRQFNCGWLVDTSLGEAWKPSLAGFVVSFGEYDQGVSILVDPRQPHAWLRPPYIGRIRAWAAAAARSGAEVVVWEGDRRIVVEAAQAVEPAAATVP